MQPTPELGNHDRKFAPMRRELGRKLFTSNSAVVLLADDPVDEIRGAVYDHHRGRATEHDVYVSFAGGDLEISCDCHGPEFCEHGYALLLQHEHQRRDQRNDGGRPSASPAPQPPAPLRAVPATPPPGQAPAARTPVPWRERLQVVAEDRDDDEDGLPPPRQQQFPMYLVDLDLTRRRGRLHVIVMQASKDPTRHTEFQMTSLRANTNTNVFPPADQNLLRLLAATKGSPFHIEAAYEFTIEPALTPTIVPLLFATGRVCQVSRIVGGPAAQLPLDPGEPFCFRTHIARTGDGTHVHGLLQRGAEVLTHRDVNAVVDGFVLLPTKAIRAQMGRATSLARALLHDGPLSASQAEERELLGSVLELTMGDPDVAPPVPTRKAPPPAPVFSVHMDMGGKNHALGELRFDYGGRMVDFDSTSVLLPEPDGDTWLLRDDDAETTLLDRVLLLLADRFDPTATPGCFTVPRKDLAAVITDLVAGNVRVLAEGKPIVRHHGFQVGVKTGIDWFDLEGTLDFGDGAQLSLGEALHAAKKGERFVQLGNGTTGMLPEDWLLRWSAVLELGEAHGEGVRLRSSQALLLDALLSAKGPATITTDAGYRRLKRRLGAFTGITPRQEPDGFHGELRPYQRAGLAWLHFLRDLGLGGCLADDMGLGKTVQVLALLQHVHAARDVRPSLLVVPRSLLDNWCREAARFTPALRVASFTTGTRWERLPPARLAEHDLVVTSYGTLRTDASRFDAEQVAFEYVILDEAQAIENAASITSKAVRLIRANHRLALTGTPVQNHLGELWALFEFLTPGLLGRSAAFKALVGNGKRSAAQLDQKLLHKALAPFLLRRTKEQVLPELPAKQEQVLTCELEGTQRKAYDALRAHYREVLGNGGSTLANKERFVALEALLRLRQAACHEALLDEKWAERSSAKLETLLPMLQEIAASGHKALVFSQFTSFLSLVRSRLEALGLDHEYLDGKTRDRQQRVDRFQADPACAAFLISLKAGGFGLNLTAADYVFLLDPWWNPAAEAQAIDRAHRLGQTRRVVAYRLVAADTVEQKVLALQAEKRALVEAVLGDESGGLLAGMTREDLLGLIG